MIKIKKITAREILDSRGYPTVEAKIWLDSGLSAKASVPSGASTGIHEACELRDGQAKRYQGLGVLRAVKNIQGEISRSLSGEDVLQPERIDRKMIKLDGSRNKSRLGANAILAVSIALVRAGALSRGQELYEYLASQYDFSPKFKLPTPAFNIFNGGRHADNNLDFQEFMIMPNPAIGKFSEKLRVGAEIFHELARVLRGKYLNTNVGHEGGYAPSLASSLEVFDCIAQAAKNLKYKLGRDIFLGVDAASSEFYDSRRKQYVFSSDQAKLNAYDLITLYHEWLDKYQVMFIEDALAEDDWSNWKILTKELGSKMILIGDDLFVSNQKRLQRGINNQVANAILIKPNQVGSVSETMDSIKLAQKNNYKIMISHRSGETNDDFIADLAVAVSADFIKSGSLSRGERLAKYNRLSEIEENLKR